MTEDGTEVKLYIYDLSLGLAQLLSSFYLGKYSSIFYQEIEKSMYSINFFKIIVSGKQIEGIWHTSIVVFGREFYFGQNGITACEPVSIQHRK